LVVPSFFAKSTVSVFALICSALAGSSVFRLNITLSVSFSIFLLGSCCQRCGILTPWMESVRAHGRAKVEQCRSNCRESGLEHDSRDMEEVELRLEQQSRDRAIVESDAGRQSREDQDVIPPKIFRGAGSR